VFNMFENGEMSEVPENGENNYNDVKRQILTEKSIVLKKEIIWDSDLYAAEPKKKLKKK
jgi:hypothetical protein